MRRRCYPPIKILERGLTWSKPLGSCYLIRQQLVPLIGTLQHWTIESTTVSVSAEDAVELKLVKAVLISGGFDNFRNWALTRILCLPLFNPLSLILSLCALVHTGPIVICVLGFQVLNNIGSQITADYLDAFSTPVRKTIVSWVRFTERANSLVVIPVDAAGYRTILVSSLIGIVIFCLSVQDRRIVLFLNKYVVVQNILCRSIPTCVSSIGLCSECVTVLVGNNFIALWSIDPDLQLLPSESIERMFLSVYVRPWFKLETEAALGIRSESTGTGDIGR